MVVFWPVGIKEDDDEVFVVAVVAAAFVFVSVVDATFAVTEEGEESCCSCHLTTIQSLFFVLLAMRMVSPSAFLTTAVVGERVVVHPSSARAERETRFFDTHWLT